MGGEVTQQLRLGTHLVGAAVWSGMVAATQGQGERPKAAAVAPLCLQHDWSTERHVLI